MTMSESEIENSPEEGSQSDYREEWEPLILEYIKDRNHFRLTNLLRDGLALPEEDLNVGSRKKAAVILREIGWSPREYGAKNKIWQPNSDPNLSAEESALPGKSLEIPDSGTVDESTNFFKSMMELMTFSAELQTQMAQNLVYIRQKNDKLEGMVTNLGERLNKIESQAHASVNVDVKSDIQESMNEIVKEIRDDKKLQLMDSVGALKSQIQFLKNEFSQLRSEEEDV